MDALTRGTLQQEIEKIWSRDRKTVVLITNDVDEGMLLADRIIPLNPNSGAGATLALEFKITLPRPRDKKSLNDHPEYKRIRNEIIKYLIQINDTRKQCESTEQITLPDLTPTVP